MANVHPQPADSPPQAWDPSVTPASLAPAPPFDQVAGTPMRPVSAQPLPAKPIPASPLVGDLSMIGKAGGAPAAQTTGDPKPDDAENEDGDAVDVAARNAPPWLLSTVVHMLVLIILGLSMRTPPNQDATVVELDVYADSLGDQLLDPGIEVAPQTFEPTADVQSLSMTNLPEVSEPFAIPAPSLTAPMGTAPSGDLAAPNIGYALSGRQAGRKAVLLGKYGGDKLTEDAVQRALAWLKRNQRPDGSWSLVGPYSDGGHSENMVAATAMALLAFQGAGHTHQEGEYMAVVEKGFNYLLRMQDREGLFSNREVPAFHLLYSHGQATIVVCEAYGMTRDSRYRAAAERAVRFCVQGS